MHVGYLLPYSTIICTFALLFLPCSWLHACPYFWVYAFPLLSSYIWYACRITGLILRIMIILWRHFSASAVASFAATSIAQVVSTSHCYKAWTMCFFDFGGSHIWFSMVSYFCSSFCICLVVIIILNSNAMQCNVFKVFFDFKICLGILLVSQMMFWSVLCLYI